MGMARQIRFYTDEHVSGAVINGLRRQGANVMSTPDAGMLGAMDERHLALASSLGRVLFTQDDDFLRLNSQGTPHTGIVYTHEGSSISRIINGLMRIHETKTPEDMIGRVEFI